MDGALARPKERRRNNFRAFGVPLRQVLAMVKLGDGVLVVTETVQEEMYTEAENSLQRVIDSLEILE